MITVRQYRDRCGEHFEQSTLRFTDPLKAVASLAEYELGWGGRIVNVGNTRLQVETWIFSCVDTSIWEGSAEEMKPLLELAYLYDLAAAEHQDQLIQRAVEQSHVLNGNALLITMAAPLIMGANRLKVAVMLACGVQEKTDIEAGLQAKIGDLVAAAELAKVGECSFIEALSL